MVVLAIDTSTRWAGVALLTPEGRGWELAWHSPQNHSAELAPAVHALLERAGMTLEHLTGIVVALGPGSFSALRVGLGFAKGLALGRGLPLVGIGTLAVEAMSLGVDTVPLCPLLDLGRGLVAWALFPQVEGERVNRVEEMPALLPPGAVVCGEGAWAYRHSLGIALAGKAMLVARPPPTRHALALARLGQERLGRGEADPVATLQPRYLRPPSIGPTALRTAP
ncbi:tRNA threonylcarbamoyladenosine biosynthesis protein TsaB [bacterium HR23]|nr:tRNA threonylcarbamoyladenosine biosynthesis protein TsaB [bacterium HR23]